MAWLSPAAQPLPSLRSKRFQNMKAALALFAEDGFLGLLKNPHKRQLLPQPWGHHQLWSSLQTLGLAPPLYSPGLQLPQSCHPLHQWHNRRASLQIPQPWRGWPWVPTNRAPAWDWLPGLSLDLANHYGPTQLCSAMVPQHPVPCCTVTDTE